MIQQKRIEIELRMEVLIPLTVGEVIQQFCLQPSKLREWVLIPLTVGEVIQPLFAGISVTNTRLNPLNSRGSDSTVSRLSGVQFDRVLIPLTVGEVIQRYG